MGDTGFKHQYRYSYVEIARCFIDMIAEHWIAIPKTVLRLLNFITI